MTTTRESLHDEETKLFNEMLPGRYVKNYLKKVTGRLQTSKKERTGEVRIRLRDRPVERTDTADN
jgi:hypothetical protein